jgi:bacillithiol biosynthesis deacetylase BshB1
MKLDILAFGAHPDDVELSCSATLMKHKDLGYKIGIIDLTRGEMGTRGSVEQRNQEAINAAVIMQLDARENLDLPDGFIENNKEQQLSIIKMIRKYQPEIIITNAFSDRHPDHGNAQKLVEEASFKAGLRKIETSIDGRAQKAWRPKLNYQYIQYRMQQPDLVIDTTGYMDRKIAAIKAYASQFYNPDSKEPQTLIASESFFDSITSRDQEMGRCIERPFAEGFTVSRTIGAKNLFDLI